MELKLLIYETFIEVIKTCNRNHTKRIFLYCCLDKMRKGEEIDGNANNYELMRDTEQRQASKKEHNNKDDGVL